MEFASKIVERVIDSVLNITVRHVTYIVRYKQNIDELNNNSKVLDLHKERVNHQWDESQNNLQHIEGTVKEWFRKVREYETRIEEIRNDEGHKETRLFNGLFPYLRNRHRLSRKAKKMTEDIKMLIDESSKFNEVAFRQNVTSNDTTLSNANYVEFGSRKSMVEEVMEKLEDSNIRMIGLYGQGGVGKSTLIKAIATKVKDNKLFNVVATSEITTHPNIQKIQEEIAYVLGLKLEGDSENVRADCLRRRLRIEKGNTLVILDDLWDKLDLNKIGIPLDDAHNDDDDDDFVSKEVDNSDLNPKRTVGKKENGDSNPKRRVGKKEKFHGDYKGCKILLTSRAKDVLTDKMSVKSELVFCVQKLDDWDSLMFFQNEARIHDEMSKYKQEIVKYCAGIPMEIVTVGRTLRGKSDSVWQATLEKLKKQELVGEHKSMEISVKMSYDHLENDELKSIFLLCAQMGHQPLIMDLVKYCFGLGILKGVYLLSEARDRIHTISIPKLKNSSLLLDESFESSDNHFNMHDMVRNAALSIAHKEHNVFTLRKEKLDDWSALEKCTSISICSSDIIDELPDFINCPELKFFQIDNDDPSLKIPKSFFEKMKKLRVLILIGVHLSSLPFSMERLSNLRMLCLERCTLAENLSIIGKLKKLRILSFSGSEIKKKLPNNLGCLDKLQLLDISNCSIMEEIPQNLISSLTCLEELYIRKTLTKMLVDGQKKKSQSPFLSELKPLVHLKVLDLCIPCFACFPEDLYFDQLNDYKIVIGHFKILSVGDFRMLNEYETSRSLALQLEDDIDIHCNNGIKLLFKRVESLLLGELSDVEDVIYKLNLDGFLNLKHLSITNNTCIKYINSKSSSHPQEIFPNLETLCLNKVRNIEKICDSPIRDDSFTKLKTIKVEMCGQLKNLFSSHMVKFLCSLEIVEVSECDSLEKIVELPENENIDRVNFPRLDSLTLHSLPSFTSFYTKVKGLSPLFDELVEILNLTNLNLFSINIHEIWSDRFFSSFCFQNLIKLTVKDCNKLRYLCSMSVACNLRNLKGLFVSGCHMMEKIFNTEGNNEYKDFVFPKLEEIHFSEMNMLIDIWQVEVSIDSFCSLISVHIEQCEKLDKIFPSHIEGWYANLEKLKVVDCGSVEVIFVIKDFQQRDVYGGIDTNLQSISLKELPKLKQVWSIDPRGILNFKKLQSIDVTSCKMLRNVFPTSVAKDVRKIEYISITDCERMMEIFAREDGLEANNEPLVFHELTNMKLYDLPNMEHFCKGSYTLFSNLEYMEIGIEEASKCKWLWSDTDNYTMHRLKDLTISSDSYGEEIDLYRFLYRMPNLEKLSLERIVPITANITTQQLGVVLHLKELVLSSSQIKDIGFLRYPVLERLSLKECDNLSVLAPPSVSLTYLTFLEVKGCDGLRNLMASSTAKSLVQLKTMKVIGCNEIEEIVTGEGDEVIEIVFNNLITIELVGLKLLKSFCNYENCRLKFPSLEILVVRECPMMETFSKNMESPPKLKNILGVEGDGEAKWQWEGDLNATILKVFNDKVSFRYSEDLSLFRYPELIEQLWQPCKLQNYFGNLKRLEACFCRRLVHVIPSHLLACFENLEELRVLGCRKTEVIFNITDEIREKKKALGIIPLKRLILEGLPKLEHVWKKDPEGIIDLQVLRVMIVRQCDSLRSLFPALVAKKDLTLRLEMLEVRVCSELVEIFSKGGEELSSVIDAEEIAKAEILVIEIRSLKKVSLDIRDMQVTWDRDSAEQLQFESVKEIEELLDNSGPLNRILIFLQMFPNIQKFAFVCCNFKEMFHAERPNADYRILLQLKGLKLRGMYSLESIGLEHSWLQPFSENLQTLQVIRCGRLSKLVASACTVYFSNLTYLTVSACDSLVSLFTSSTAKSLGRLKRLKVKTCKSLEEIVTAENESDEIKEIIFVQLQILYLKQLLQLRSEHNRIDNSIQCFTEKNGTPQQCSSDLNTAVQLIFQEKIFQSTRNVSRLDLSDNRPLQQIWLKPLVSIPNTCFNELVSLIVDECEFLSDAVLPFNLLPFFTKLKTLQVTLCGNVKTIFDVQCITQDRGPTPISFLLENLTLWALPKLENVWNEDPDGVLSMQLQQVEVNDCECLSSVFPASMAKELVKLEKLVVKECKELIRIVGEDNGDRNVEVRVAWPSLTSLELCRLPNLKYFENCSALLIEKLPKLEHLAIGSENVLKIIKGNILHKLKVVIFSDFDESDIFPYEFLDTERLEVRDSSFKDIFCLQNPNTDEFLSHHKELRLDSLPNLTQSATSFSNVTYLQVSGCNALLHLFTSSIVKSLALLKSMKIEECDSIEEIVV
ncbi:hypothetical protein Fmac_010954 [Flemingia macrophylla]|uniref:AAA+ ATPase domain-containing protein n=1 Tax=Flemingia macrophylla TaxID=520843 RepID=A0ABD1ML21_9FABA